MKLYTMLALYCGTVCAQDSITIYNTTNKTLYGQLLYVKHADTLEEATAASEPFTLLPMQHITVPRPPRSYYWGGWYDRVLQVTDDPQKTAPLMFNHLTLNIGTLQGSCFFIAQSKGLLQGYNALGWNTRLLQEALDAVFCFLLEEVREQHSNHQYSTSQALICGGDILAHEEAYYLRKRAQHIAEKNPQGAPLRIALCASGGGYRAMVSTLGYLQGAQDIGLLDAATYIAGVSGSTWAIAGYIQSGLAIDTYIQLCADHIEKSFIYDHDSDQVALALLKQFAFTQNISLIDFYGALLAQKILKPLATLNPHDIDLYSQTEKIEDGKQLFPLYTALVERPGEPYGWVEFTPYEVHSSCLGAGIPAWAFGRKFYGGSSCDFAPSQSLGFYMGIWGSALSANLQDVVYRYSERLSSGLLLRLLQNVISNFTHFSQSRLTAAEVCNWTAGTNLPYAHLEKLRLLDAGLDCNLPLVPLLDQKRAIDIIIVLDATYRGDNGLELQRAQRYAQENNMPFPPIDYQHIYEPCSVHADWENPSVPVIIYLPLRKHPEYQQGWDPYQHNFIGTFNFKYTREQFLLLSGLTAHCIRESKSIIFDTIAQVIARKKQLQVD